jgi:hypothetical protein
MLVVFSSLGGIVLAQRGGAQGTATPAAKAWIAVDLLNVEIEHAAGAKVSPVGARGYVMIADRRGRCSIILDDIDWKKDSYRKFAREVSFVEKQSKFKEWVRKEQTADGHVLLNTQSTSMDPTVTQYSVSVQRKVGDRDFACSGTSNYGADDAACMIAACLSVRAK